MKKGAAAPVDEFYEKRQLFFFAFDQIPLTTFSPAILP